MNILMYLLLFVYGVAIVLILTVGDRLSLFHFINRGQQLVGAWRIQIYRTSSNLPSLVEVCIFTADGNMVNVAPNGGTSVGRWAFIGKREFNVTFVGLLLRDEQPFSYRIRGQFQLDETGDKLNGPYQYELIDANDTVTASAHGTVLGTRISVKSLG